MKQFVGLLVGFFFLLWPVVAQEKKSVEAFRTTKPLIVDAILDEPVYAQAQPARHFLQIEPYNGKPCMQKTDVWFFYDQSAIYVGAILYDNQPDSIFNFLSERDNIGQSDYFGVYFDPFNTGQLAFGFFLNPSGVQVDIKATKSNDGGDNEDSNWNAVWESKTRITDVGWMVEMRIPFSELRFSDASVGTWGMNMFRNIRRYSSNNSWNFIDRKMEGFIDQQGHLSGIKDINPPLRLSLTPYLATYLQKESGAVKPDFLYKGGLDLKYGLDESFTLDMMVIPDFGQIPSDDKKLNLSPYEIYYSEKRQFFTESTELFNRANIFYSRRIGAGPAFSGDAVAGSHEDVVYNPGETQLVNATKISGRSNKGWGLGLLNAMSLPSYARIVETETGYERKVRVQPFTNYNVMVVDKSLKNNSYVSLINTNVSMVDHPFSANVTATEFELRNKARSYVLKGRAAMSVRGSDRMEAGYSGLLSAKKSKGDFLFGVEQKLYTDTYNPNDMGYLQNNNTATTSSWAYYQIIEPFSVFRDMNGHVYWDYSRMYRPNVFSKNQWGCELNTNFTNNYKTNLNGFYQSLSYDYFEPRVKGRYYKSPALLGANFNLNTDWRKPLSFYFYYGLNHYVDSDRYAQMGEITAVCRLGQRVRVEYDMYASKSINDEGFADKNETNDSIHFSKRHVLTLSNVLYASYVINNKSSLSIRGRHYWSGVENKAFYLLQEDGSLLSDGAFTNKDKNYNALTIDMAFRWVFAPGSEMTVAWKNTAYSSQEKMIRDYWQNVRDSWAGQANSLSLKLLYYIDYNKLKRKA